MADEETRFTDSVASAFSADQSGARSLWVPLAQQFDADGPDAVRQYLKAQRQQLVDHVEKLLRQVKDRTDG